MDYSDKTWYVGSGGYKYNPCVPDIITEYAYLIPHLHICDEKTNVQSTSWHSPKAAHAKPSTTKFYFFFCFFFQIVRILTSY